MEVDKTKDEIPTNGRKRKDSELELSGNISEEFPMEVEPASGSEDGGKSSIATAMLTLTSDIVETPIKLDADSIAGTSKDVPDGLINGNESNTENTENSGSITGSPSLISGKTTRAKTLKVSKTKKRIKRTRAKKLKVSKTKRRIQTELVPKKIKVPKMSSFEVFSIRKEDVSERNADMILARKKRRYTFLPKPTPESTCYLEDVSYANTILLLVFPYLKLRDLRSAMHVCTLWRDVALRPLLWKKVQMNNFKILNVEGLRDVLHENKTVHLDLRGILLPKYNDNFWVQFKEIIKLDTLKKIELCCPRPVIEEIIASKPKWEVINVILTNHMCFNLAPVACHKNLIELCLKPDHYIILTSTLDELAGLTSLRNLSLAFIHNLSSLNLQVITNLTNLESLTLGSCTGLPKSFGSNILVQLSKLKKLRLEEGIDCFIFDILYVVKTMSHIQELELINFEIQQGFDYALSACTNIKKLLIIPIYCLEDYATDQVLLRGVLRLSDNLSHFVWGITQEHVELTEMFVKQCQHLKKMGLVMKGVNGGSCMALSKPIQFVDDDNDTDGNINVNKFDLEKIRFNDLRKIFVLMPTTHVKILSIDIDDTWKQTIANNFK